MGKNDATNDDRRDSMRNTCALEHGEGAERRLLRERSGRAGAAKDAVLAVRRASGVMVRRMPKELYGKALGADLDGERPRVRGHVALWHERARCEREQDDARAQKPFAQAWGWDGIQG